MNDVSEYFIFFFQSVAFFMAIFFFIQYRILKKIEYLWYTLYLLFLVVYYLLAIPEFFFHVAAGDAQSIAGYNLFKRPVQFIISVWYTLFVIAYLRLGERSNPLFRIFKTLLVFYVILAIACLAGNFFGLPYDPAYYTISMLLFPVQLYVVIALFKYKVPYAVYIIWGTIIVLVGSLVTLMLSLVLATNPASTLTNEQTYIPVMVSILVDIFLFTVALQRKIADNERSLVDAAYNRQQAVLLERERIIADLHDDVGGGLSSIRMMSDLMARQQVDNTSAPVNFALKISATAREIAQRMNTIVWSLNTENDTLQNFIEYVRQFGVAYFENSPIRFQCTSSGSLPMETDLGGVQRKNLFLIIKEALHNTLKHSGADSASVWVHMQGDELCIEVSDNGAGFKEAKTFGNGLKNMKKRMDEINGHVNFSSGHGAKIIITLMI